MGRGGVRYTVGNPSHRRSRLRSCCLWMLACISLPVWSAEYTVSLIPDQTYTTLTAAESAMRAASIQASYLQYTGIVSQTTTERVFSYAAPDQVPTIWWLANIGNTGPGPYGGTLEPSGNCQSCLLASGGFSWTGVLTPYPDANGPYFGCQFVNSLGEIQNNGCIVTPYPACNPGYSLAGTQSNWRCINQLTATITERLGACPIRPPTPYSPDPYPLNTDKLSQNIKDALTCLDQQQGVSVARGNLTNESAYRPPAYNLHLQEVWDKWVDNLKEENRPACQALRTEVENHFKSHGLKDHPDARPHTYSAHTRDPAEALDLSSTLGYPELDRRAGLCQLYRPIPRTDPPHYIHR